MTIFSEARGDLKLYRQLAEYLSGVTKMSWEEYVQLCNELAKLGRGTQ